MAVKEDNKRISFKLSKKEYEDIEKLAKEDARSVSNYMYKVIREHLDKLEE